MMLKAVGATLGQQADMFGSAISRRARPRRLRSKLGAMIGERDAELGKYRARTEFEICACAKKEPAPHLKVERRKRRKAQVSNFLRCFPERLMRSVMKVRCFSFWPGD